MREVTLIQFGIGFTLGFVLGSTLGWVIASAANKGRIRGWERSLISIVVLLVWVASTLADIAVENYDTPTAVHTIMGLVAGFFFEGSLADIFSRREKEKIEQK